MPLQMGADFLNITNPANFGWYLPYYASLGLANMMMVPFLSSQMMAFQNSNSSSLTRSDDEDAGAGSSSQQQQQQRRSSTTSRPAPDLPRHSSSTIRPVLSSPYVSSSHSHNRTHTMTSPPTSSTTSEAPLDLSVGKNTGKTHGKSLEKSSASGCGASPLDLSVKTSDVSSTIGKPTSHSATHSSRKSTPSRHKQSTSRKGLAGGGGFLNPALDAISKWTTADVIKFVSSVEGCQQYTQVWYLTFDL